MHTGAEITSLTYTASTNVLGTIEFTINGSTKYVTEKSVQNCTNTTSCTLQIQGNNSGTEGSNTISVKLTPSSYNYSNGVKYSDNWNSKTVNVTGSAVPTYWIKYNMNGGTGTIADQIKVKGTNLTLSSTVPTREGFAFQGWATSSTGSVVYAKGGSYTANSGATLYAVWKDNQAPSLSLSKITYREGFDGWDITGNTKIQNNIATVKSNSLSRGNLNSPYFDVNGETWYQTFDAYTSVASTTQAPDQNLGSAGSGPGGIAEGSSYFTYDLQPAYASGGYQGNGNAPSLPLNTWSNNFTWGYHGYHDGPNVKLLRIYYDSGSTYASNPFIIRNYKMWGQLTNTFYLINVTSSDNVGVTAIKYMSGNQTKETCISNGSNVSNNQIRVTSNGTYTVCVADAAGNSSVQTITIDRIGNPYIEQRNRAEGGHWGYIYINGTLQTVPYISQGSIASAVDRAMYEYNSNNSYIYQNIASANNLLITPFVQGTNNYNFTSSISGVNTVQIYLYASSYTSTSFYLAALKIKVDNAYYTLEQLVRMGWIEPYVLMNSSRHTTNNYYWPNFLNLYGGGQTGSSPYPQGIIYFVTRAGHTFQGIQLYSSANSNTLNNSDNINISYKSGAVITYGNPTSAGPGGTVYWNDNYSGTVYKTGTQPSIYWGDYYMENTWIKNIYIKTVNGGHRVCLNLGGNEACFRPYYWITDGATTATKLKNDLISQLGSAYETQFTCTSSSTDAKCTNGNYYCNAASDNSIFCGITSSKVHCMVEPQQSKGAVCWSTS